MAGEVIVAPWQGAQQPEGGAGVVRVLLRHEGRLNAMTRAMWLQLRSVFEALARTPELRCVLIEGEGEAFCAGGDISEYPGFRFDAAQLRHFKRMRQPRAEEVTLVVQKYLCLVDQPAKGS